MYISVRLIAGYRSANLPPTYLLILSVFTFLTRILIFQYVYLSETDTKYRSANLISYLVLSESNLSPTYLKCI